MLIRGAGGCFNSLLLEFSDTSKSAGIQNCRGPINQIQVWIGKLIYTKKCIHIYIYVDIPHVGDAHKCKSIYTRAKV